MGKRKKRDSPFIPKSVYNNFTDSAYMNNATFLDYFYRMREIWLNLYKLKNLPTLLNKRYIMIQLFENSKIAFFEDEVLEKIATLPFAVRGKLNIYDEPNAIDVFSNNGYRKSLSRNEFEILYLNYSKIPPSATIQLFAYRLYEIERSLDVNIQNQKTSKIACVPESQRLSFDNFIKDIKGNVPFIMVSDLFNVDDIKEVDLTSPYIADKLDVHKHNVWNEFLTWCGIENANADKKERLVQDEVGSNFGNVEMSRNSNLQCMRDSLEKINTRFGTEIEVEFNSELESNVNKGGAEYE